MFNTLSTIEKNSIINFEKEYYDFSNKLSLLETLTEIEDAFLDLFSQIFRKEDAD